MHQQRGTPAKRQRVLCLCPSCQPQQSYGGVTAVSCMLQQQSTTDRDLQRNAWAGLNSRVLQEPLDSSQTWNRPVALQMKQLQLHVQLKCNKLPSDQVVPRFAAGLSRGMQQSFQLKSKVDSQFSTQHGNATGSMSMDLPGLAYAGSHGTAQARQHCWTTAAVAGATATQHWSAAQQEHIQHDGMVGRAASLVWNHGNHCQYIAACLPGRKQPDSHQQLHLSPKGVLQVQPLQQMHLSGKQQPMQGPKWQQQPQQEQRQPAWLQQHPQQTHTISARCNRQHWHSAGLGSMWKGLEPYRRLLLNAHSVLGDKAYSTEQLLALVVELKAQAASSNTSAERQPHSAKEQLQVAADAVRPAHAWPSSGKSSFSMQECYIPQQHYQQKQHQQHIYHHQYSKEQQQQEQQQEQVLQQTLNGSASSDCTRAAGLSDVHQGVAAANAARQPQTAVQAASADRAPAAAGKPPVPPRPPKRPWQPKMRPQEHNWNKEAFAVVEPQVMGSLFKQAQQHPDCPPEWSTAQVAVVMMLHDAGWPNHLVWGRWQAAHPPGSVAMLVHMKAGVKLQLDTPGCDAISRNKLRTSVNSKWGDISLVQAQLDSLAEVLRRCPNATHVAIASGHDIPVQLIQPGLLLPSVSLFGAYEFGEPEARLLRVASVEQLMEDTILTEAEAQAWGRALIFHHQWMVLSRQHAAALVSLRRDICVVGRVIQRACDSVQAGMAPDEFILITALRAHGFVHSIQRVELKPGMRYPLGCLLNSYPTLVLFPAATSPHPVLWTDLHKKIKCQVEKHTGQQYSKMFSLNECLDICMERCALFFRKVQIRPQGDEKHAALLITLEKMWAGKRRKASNAITTSVVAKAANGSSSNIVSQRSSKRQHEDSQGPATKTMQNADSSFSASSSVSGVDTDSGEGVECVEKLHWDSV